MDESSNAFFPLLVVVLLAFSVPLITSRFRRFPLPVVVGEILAGVLVGRSGLGWVIPGNEILTLLAEFGFVFLMFLAGMEIDFSSLGPMPASSGATKRGATPGTSQRWGVLPLSLFTFLLTLLLSLGVGFSLTYAGLVQNPWMMGLILSTTSLGVVMPVLKERGLTGSRFGQTVLIAALVADFATMLLITLEVAALSHGTTLDILLIGALFAIFFLTYRLGLFSFNRLSIVRKTLEELSHTTIRIKIRGAFTVMLFFVVLSEALGVEIILGAFMAGAILSLLSTSQEIETSHQLEAVGFGFFIPIFFIMVGVEFNLAALLRSSEALLVLPILLTAAVLVKLLPVLLFRVNFTWRETWAAGALLSARLSLIIAASAIGLRLGIISESVNAAVILVAILSVTLAPLAFQRLLPPSVGNEFAPMVVFGAGELGMLVAEDLNNHREHVALIDDDPTRVARANHLQQAGVEVLLARDGYDARITALLNEADAIVVTYNDSELTRQICHMVRTEYGKETVIALVNEPHLLKELQQIGVTAINPALEQAALLSLLARNPTVYELLTHTGDDKEVHEVVVRRGAYADKPLRELDLPGDVLILALRRGDEFLVPRGNSVLELGDRLTLAGTFEHVTAARHMFERGDRDRTRSPMI